MGFRRPLVQVQSLGPPAKPWKHDVFKAFALSSEKSKTPRVWNIFGTEIFERSQTGAAHAVFEGTFGIPFGMARGGHSARLRLFFQPPSSLHARFPAGIRNRRCFRSVGDRKIKESSPIIVYAYVVFSNELLLLKIKIQK